MVTGKTRGSFSDISYWNGSSKYEGARRAIGQDSLSLDSRTVISEHFCKPSFSKDALLDGWTESNSELRFDGLKSSRKLSSHKIRSPKIGHLYQNSIRQLNDVNETQTLFIINCSTIQVWCFDLETSSPSHSCWMSIPTRIASRHIDTLSEKIYSLCHFLTNIYFFPPVSSYDQKKKSIATINSGHLSLPMCAER